MDTKILILISVVLLIILIFYSDIDKVASQLSRADMKYIILGLLLWFTGAVLRNVRWRCLLNKLGKGTQFLKTFKVLISGIFLSNLTPAKIGEPIRSILLKRVSKIGIGESLPSLFIERMLDVITMILISIFGFVLLTKLPSISLWFELSIIVYVLIFSLAVFIFVSTKRTVKFLSIFSPLFSFIPEVKKMQTKIKSFSKSISESFKSYKDTKTIVIAEIYTIFIWILEGVIFYLAFKSIGLEVSLLSTIVITAITTSIAILTFLPGGLGSGEIIYVILFTALFNLGLSEVTAAILIARFLSLWMYALFGSILLPTLK